MMQIPAHQPLLQLTRHTKLVTDVGWNQRPNVQNINASTTGRLICWPLLHMVAVDWDNMVSKHHELIVNMLKRSSINASYYDTDLVTDVLWNHNIWARFQYSAHMCIQSMQAKIEYARKHHLLMVGYDSDASSSSVLHVTRHYKPSADSYTLNPKAWDAESLSKTQQHRQQQQQKQHQKQNQQSDPRSNSCSQCNSESA